MDAFNNRRPCAPLNNKPSIPGGIDINLGPELTSAVSRRNGPAMQELAVNKASSSSIKEGIVAFSGCLIYVVLGVGLLTLLVMFLKGTPWMAKNIYPWVIIIGTITLFLVVPGSFFLSIFKKTRGAGGLGLLASSYVFGLNLWMSSLIVSYKLAGIFWIIMGLIFGGIGIVPVAFIASLIKAKWSIAGEIALTVVIVIVLRGVGNYFIEKASEQPISTDLPSEESPESTYSVEELTAAYVEMVDKINAGTTDPNEKAAMLEKLRLGYLKKKKELTEKAS